MSTVTKEMIDAWADEKSDIVALHLKQRLMPVEGEGAVIFPPTYADIGYNIDTLSDGTKVCTIDSVGSQANRMEPIFKRDDLKHLVPQVTVKLPNGKIVSILDAGHRLGDALIRASNLRDGASKAFSDYQAGNAEELAKLAPTSLVFGAWDSRGGGAKVPRLVSAVVRAWNIELLHRAAVYLPPTDYTDEAVLGPHNDDKAEKDARSALGFQHAPATWSANDHIPQYRDGKPNPDRMVPGGIIARGEICRDVTVNLVALRQLGGSPTLRSYILSLALVAATDPLDGFLRQGCQLTLDLKYKPLWHAVFRDGRRQEIELTPNAAIAAATQIAQMFGVGDKKEATFAVAAARELLDEQKGGKKKGKGKKQDRDEDEAGEAA